MLDVKKWLQWCKRIRIKYTLNAFTPRNRGFCVFMPVWNVVGMEGDRGNKEGRLG